MRLPSGEKAGRLLAQLLSAVSATGWPIGCPEGDNDSDCNALVEIAAKSL